MTVLKSTTLLTFCLGSFIINGQNRGGNFNFFNYIPAEQTQNNGLGNSGNVSNINQIQVQQIQSNSYNHSFNNGPNTGNINPNVRNIIQLNNDNNIQTNINSYNNSNLNNSIQVATNDITPRNTRNINITNISNEKESNIELRGNRGGNEVQQKIEIQQIQTIQTVDNVDEEVADNNEESTNNESRSINIELPKITAPKIELNVTPKVKEEKTSETTQSVEKTTTSSNISSANSSKSSKKVKQHKFKKKVLKPMGSWFRRTFKKKTHKGVFSVKCFSFNN